MALKCVSVSREVTIGEGPGGEFRLGDSLEMLDSLVEKYTGKVKCIYLDPPFLTGQMFEMSVRIGVNDWQNMAGSVKVPTFSDTIRRDEYYSQMRRLIDAFHAMLRDDGALFIHVDYRAHARLRIMGDEIFGEDNFVNEIIWAYKSGGRARQSFPRKHDVILFYRKSKDLDFHMENIMERRSEPPRNHMRRHVDSDGRVYRSIRSGGRVYTYYDDEPVMPSDVWDDISHLQQKDYERTGYDTQKPLRLLSRIIRCCTKPGDIVMDLFAGSGTALEAAKLDGRAFVGADMCPFTVNILRRRLADCQVEYSLTPSRTEYVECDADYEDGVGVYTVTLNSFHLESGALSVNGFDAIDNWAAGYISDGVFRSAAHFERTKKTPGIVTQMYVPVYEGVPAIRIGDVAGESWYFILNEPEVQ